MQHAPIALLAALAIAAPLTGVHAQQAGPPACTAGSVKQTGELSAWNLRSPLTAARSESGLAKATLRVGGAVEATLSSTSSVRYATQPEKPGGAESFGGLFIFTVERAGTYRVALGTGAWVDVLKGNQAVTATAHSHGPECSGIQKMVDFPLTPGRYTLQIAANSDPTLQLMLARLAASGSAHAAGTGATIGLVLTDWRYALRETPTAEECPDGLQPSEVLQFKAQPDPVGHLNKFGGTTQNRGPIGENANYSPLAVEDPIPFHELKTKLGYGFNLDGTSDGHATPKSKAHEKFSSAEGEPVDNQIARVLGCVQGWRTTGYNAEFYSKEVETSPINRHLIEISGVDDENNDADVEVAIYKGRDRLVRAASGAFIPLISHRVDERFPQYQFRTHGRIVNGTLITDPIPLVRLPLLQIQIPEERRIRDLQLRLKLSPTGAEGLLGGYEELASWWNNHSKSPASDIGRYSPGALYRALYRYADGYPDPVTGKPTAISVAYKVSAVRALIVHPGQARPGTIVAQSESAR